MKKIYAFLMLITIILSITLPVSALSIGAPYATESSRLLSVAEYKLTEMGASNNISIECTKTLYDFIGNEYTVFECEPTGYMIYDNTNGVFTETSKSAPSPYKNYQKALFYCGPTNYYYLDGSTQNLVHTILSYDIIQISEIEDYAEMNQAYADIFAEFRNTTVVNYVENSTIGRAFSELPAVTNASTMGTIKTNQIPNASFFSKLSENFGYDNIYDAETQTVKGICGYIALGMVIAYKDNMDKVNYIPDKFWDYPPNGTNTRTQLLDSSVGFARYLYETFGKNDIGTGTNAEDRAIICERFFNSINKNVSQTYKTSFNKYTIMEEIDNGNPVILGGITKHPSSNEKDSSIKDENASHAVVLYKYTHEWGFWNAPTYTVHYGWYDYSEVEIIGSAGTVDNIGVIYSISNK